MTFKVRPFLGLAVAGEDISAGVGVVLSLGDNLVFSASNAGEYVGEAVEQIREGFRVSVKDGEVREDGA